MHRRYYTLQAMHKAAESAQSQVSPPAGKQCQHCVIDESACTPYALHAISLHHILV